MLRVPCINSEVQKLTDRSGLPLLGNRQFHAHVPGFIGTVIHAQRHFEFAGVDVGLLYAALDVFWGFDVGQPHPVASHGCSMDGAPVTVGQRDPWVENSTASGIR